jgi:cytoskeletal protein CcmA (bactofilin family)
MSLFGAPQSDLGTDTPSTSSGQTPMAKPSLTKSTPSPATIIANGVRLEGEFKSQGDVQIEGEVIGTVETSAMLSVGSEAKVKASVKAEDAVVAGQINGNVNVTKKLELKSTAKIVGDITCATIVVEAGAKLQGNIKSGSDNSAKPTNEPAKPEVKNQPPITPIKIDSNSDKPKINP